MLSQYHKCCVCGGDLSERKITVDYRWRETLVTVLKMSLLGSARCAGSSTSKLLL